MANGLESNLESLYLFFHFGNADRSGGKEGKKRARIRGFCICIERSAGGDEVRDTRRIPRFPAIRPFRAVSVCVQGGGRGTGEAGEPLQTADEGTMLAGFKYLRGAAPLLDSYGLTWKTTGPDDLVPTPRPMPKVVLVCPLFPRDS